MFILHQKMEKIILQRWKPAFPTKVSRHGCLCTRSAESSSHLDFCLGNSSDQLCSMRTKRCLRLFRIHENVLIFCLTLQAFTLGYFRIHQTAQRNWFIFSAHTISQHTAFVFVKVRHERHRHWSSPTCFSYSLGFYVWVPWQMLMLTYTNVAAQLLGVIYKKF